LICSGSEKGDRVAGQKPPHELTEISVQRPKQHMDMISHQRPRKAFGVHLRQQVAKAIKKRQPVVIEEYVPLLNPSYDYVLKDSGYVKTCGTRHAINSTSFPWLVIYSTTLALK